MSDKEAHENTSAAAVAATKHSPYLMPLAGGAVVFVVFTLIFSLQFGVFSSSNVSPSTALDPSDSPGETTAPTGSQTEDRSKSYHTLFAGFDDDNGTTDSAKETDHTADSIAKVNWYESKKQEIDRKMLQIESERAQLLALRAQVEALLEKKQAMEQGNIEQMAKLYEGMNTEDLVPILSNLEDAQVSVLISKMKKQKASEVLGKMKPERAARITQYIISMNQ